MIGVAGAFAAFAMVFDSPIIAAIILIEAAGISGSTATLVVLPALLAGAIGSLVYLGMGSLTGLSTDAYALKPLSLPAIGNLTLADFGWTILVALAAAVVAFAVVELGRAAERSVRKRPFLLVPLAGIVVAGLAIAFSEITGQPVYAVLFSGSRALDPIIEQAAALSLATIAWLFLFKGLAWGISMGSFRGGPVFPAIFLGTAGGLLASYLPGFSEGAAVAAVMAATVVAVLRLPMASAVIAVLLTSSAGLAASPLIIVAVVISYVTVDKLFAWRSTAGDASSEAASSGAGGSASAGTAAASGDG